MKRKISFENKVIFFSSLPFLILFFVFFLTRSPFHSSKTALAPQPDWNDLEPFQETISQKEFLELLNRVYSPDGGYQKFIRIEKSKASIQTNPKDSSSVFQLRFQKADFPLKAVPRYWKTFSEIKNNSQQSLSNLKIAIDPGHIGGEWAKMEKRWFQFEPYQPIIEGDITLQVGQLLAKKLESFGATVTLVRNSANPVTPKRPEDFAEEAKEIENEKGEFTEGSLEWKEKVQRQKELLFYRVSEIRERAKEINERIRPDVVLCLHLNAEEWKDPDHPSLVDRNHLHVLVNGAYTENELNYEDIRHEMLLKLLNRSHREELGIAESIAKTMSRQMSLPPPLFPGGEVIKIGSNPYVWGRNLLANRLYQAPVIYLEPYVMNNPSVIQRINWGDYRGKKELNGELRESLYEEYANSVLEGILEYYNVQRDQ